MNKTEKALKMYLETVELSKKDLSDHPLSSRAGWAARINDAKKDTKTMRSQYESSLFESLVVVGVTGEAGPVKEFCNFAANRPDTVIVDRDALYMTLAERVYPHVGDSKTYGPAQHNFFLILFRGILADMGLSIVSAPQLKEAVVANNPAELMPFLRKTVEDSIGDGLVGLFLRGEITERAINKRIETEKVFALIINGDSKITDALKANSKQIVITSPVDDQTFSMVFEKLSGKVKNKENSRVSPQVTGEGVTDQSVGTDEPVLETKTKSKNKIKDVQ